MPARDRLAAQQVLRSSADGKRSAHVHGESCNSHQIRFESGELFIEGFQVQAQVEDPDLMA